MDSLIGSAVNGESVFDGKFFQISRAAKIRPVGKVGVITMSFATMMNLSSGTFEANQR